MRTDCNWSSETEKKADRSATNLTCPNRMFAVEDLSQNKRKRFGEQTDRRGCADMSSGKDATVNHCCCCWDGDSCYCQLKRGYLWKEAYCAKAASVWASADASVDICTHVCVCVCACRKWQEWLASVLAADTAAVGWQGGRICCNPSNSSIPPLVPLAVSPGVPLSFPFTPLSLHIRSLCSCFPLIPAPPTVRWCFGRNDIKMWWLQLHNRSWWLSSACMCLCAYRFLNQQSAFFVYVLSKTIRMCVNDSERMRLFTLAVYVKLQRGIKATVAEKLHTELILSWEKSHGHLQFHHYFI